MTIYGIICLSHDNKHTMIQPSVTYTDVSCVTPCDSEHWPMKVCLKNVRWWIIPRDKCQKTADSSLLTQNHVICCFLNADMNISSSLNSQVPVWDYLQLQLSIGGLSKALKESNYHYHTAKSLSNYPLTVRICIFTSNKTLL